MGFAERLSRATASKDLGVHTDRVRDVDYLAAMGAAGQHHPEGMAVANGLLRQDGKHELVRIAFDVAKEMNRKHKWRIDKVKDLVYLATATAEHLKAPVCDKCNGVGYEKIAGTPALSARACPACRGTGKKPLPVRLKKQVLMLVTKLENEYQAAISSAKKHLE